MTLLYADTSALARAYLPDEPDHETLRAILLEGTEPVVTSELARLELASAITAAARAKRLPRVRRLLARIETDLGSDGPVALVVLRSDVVFPTALRLVIEHRLRTLDAIHLAVAIEEFSDPAPAEGLAFVTRDRQQAAAARAMGLSVG